jgi:lysozyme family protein
MDFDTAFTQLLGHEGGYSNHSADPGGETMWGVTVAVARQNGYQGPMKSMPVDLAKAIYRKRFWTPAKCDQLPPAVRYPMFDAAVNSGVLQATKWLQRAARVEDDGIIGDGTLKAVALTDANLLVRRMLGQRLRFMTDLRTWDAFGKGWARRIASLLDA